MAATVVKTHWVNVITGERLDRAAVARFRIKARRAYEANAHIFEDEMDALAALGVVVADDDGRSVMAVAFLLPSAESPQP